MSRLIDSYIPAGIDRQMELSNGRAREIFYLNEQQQEDLWRPTPPALSFASMPWGAVEKEHMFEKVVTPSDVGKLNRLVIPKQHAEKYFPMGARADRTGLLLSFEDYNGEAWRFRYSYWSSSQSYVMTKGWSRFVKDKRLNAGDTVSFARVRGEGGRERLFIDWKRSPVPRIPTAGVPFERSSGLCWGGYQLFFPPPPPTAMVHYNHSIGGQLLFFQSPANSPHQADLKPNIESGDPIDHRQANAGKGVRLFGVNLVCPEPKRDGDAGGGSEGTSLTGFPLLQLQHSSVEYSSSLASSSSTSREQHSSLDLDL